MAGSGCKSNLSCAKVSVYKGQEYLEEAIHALCAQTYRNFELLISDNGSGDKTRDICMAFASQDERIRYYRHSVNMGAAWNFNFVFQQSRGIILSGRHMMI